MYKVGYPIPPYGCSSFSPWRLPYIMIAPVSLSPHFWAKPYWIEKSGPVLWPLLWCSIPHLHLGNVSWVSFTLPTKKPALLFLCIGFVDSCRVYGCKSCQIINRETKCGFQAPVHQATRLRTLLALDTQALNTRIACGGRFRDCTGTISLPS